MKSILHYLSHFFLIPYFSSEKSLNIISIELLKYKTIKIFTVWIDEIFFDLKLISEKEWDICIFDRFDLTNKFVKHIFIYSKNTGRMGIS